MRLWYEKIGSELDNGSRGVSWGRGEGKGRKGEGVVKVAHKCRRLFCKDLAVIIIWLHSVSQ